MVKFRWYYDKDKEEIWLNEMAQEGYAMTHFFLGFYWFEECEKGEYIYQIDLFTENKRNMTHREYVNLIEETGAEYVGRWFWWRFFRRKAELGEFELYTDASSKIEQFQRIFRFFRAVAILESICFVYELVLIGIHWYQLGSYSSMLLGCELVIAVVAAALWNICYQTKKKIKSLENGLV